MLRDVRPKDVRPQVVQAPSRVRDLMLLGLGALLSAAMVIVVWAAQRTMLEDEKVALQVTSIPTGAEVRVDGVDVGYTPVTTNVRPGRHSVVVRHMGHEPSQQVISVEPQQQQAVQVVFERRSGVAERSVNP